MKVDVLLPKTSQYNVIHYFTERLYEAFQRAGCHCRLLAGEERIHVPLNDPPDLTICFNGAPSLPDDEWLADHIQKPHFCWLLDPPYHFWELTQSQWIWLACDDQFGCEILRRSQFTRSFFLPHAVEREFYGDPQSDRPYEMVMMATYIDSETRHRNWRKKFGASAAKAMELAVEESLNEIQTSFIEVLFRSLEVHGPRKIEEEMRRSIFEEFELYLKGVERQELVRLFSDREVHIFGSSIDKRTWADEFANCPTVIVHPQISYPESLEVIKKTKFLLNSGLKNKWGAHERLFAGIAGGAQVITYQNPYLQAEFGENLLLYTWKDREKLPDRVANLTTRPQKIQNAYQQVLAHHTWDHRVASLLKCLNAISR